MPFAHICWKWLAIRKQRRNTTARLQGKTVNLPERNYLLMQAARLDTTMADVGKPQGIEP
jgi:hypothetical protein